MMEKYGCVYFQFHCVVILNHVKSVELVAVVAETETVGEAETGVMLHAM